MAEDFPNYDSQTRKVFATEIYSSRGAKLSTEPSSSKSDSALSVRSSDEMHEAIVLSQANVITRISTRRSWSATKENKGSVARIPKLFVYLLPHFTFCFSF